MKEQVKVLHLDRPEQKVTMEALNDYRNKRLAEGKTAEIASHLMQDIGEARTKRVRVRDDAR